MTITVTELRKHLGKYIQLSRQEDIFITKHEKDISVMTSKHVEKLARVDSLVGVMSKDVSKG